MYRQQLNRRNAERGEVVDDHRMTDGRVCSTDLIWNARMSHRKTLHMHLVDDALVVLMVGWSIMTPIEERRGNHRQHGVAQGVHVVELVRGNETVGEQRLVTVDLATDGLRVRIEQELRRVAPLTFGRHVRTVDPIAVTLARLDPWQVGMPDVAIDLDELEARLLAVVVDQAQLDLGCNF